MGLKDKENIMKIIKLLCLILCLFLLGGCGLMKNTKEREERHQKVQDEMMTYMEDKYGETFKGSSMEYSPRIEGEYSDYGVVIPDKYKDTYVGITRLEDENGRVTFTDDYQSYILGNEFFEYVNSDIQQTYPNSFSYTTIKILDDTSAKKSFDECKESAQLDFFIALYVVEGEDTIENVKKIAEEYAMKYHKEFNNASLLFTIFWTNEDGMRYLKETTNNNEDKEYYVKEEIFNNARTVKIETGTNNAELVDISVTAEGTLKYQYTEMNSRR